MASASAVECTTTVWMPSSLQARNTLRAISPRLAMRIFWNMRPAFRRYSMTTSGMPYSTGCGILDEDRRHRARARRRYLVHRLHRLDDQQGLTFLDRLADLDERLGVGRRRQIGRADHRRRHSVLREARAMRRRTWDAPSSEPVSAPHRPAGRGNGMDRRRLLRDAHLEVVEFNLDLGQVRFVQDSREVADQLLVNAGLLCRHFKAFSLSGSSDPRRQRLKR